VEGIRARLRELESRREQDGQLLDELDPALRKLAGGASADAAARATRAAADFDRASGALDRARRDLDEALAALVAPEAGQPPVDVFRPATPTVKVRAVPPGPKPGGTGDEK